MSATAREVGVYLWELAASIPRNHSEKYKRLYLGGTVFTHSRHA